MDKPTRDIAVGSLAIGAAVLSLYLGFRPRGPKLDLNTYEVLGAVTAEETAKLVGGQGRVMVMARDTGPARNPSAEAELGAFQKTLKKHAGLSLVTERIPVTPMLMMATGGSVPPGQFLKALQTHANLGAIVLFFGFPQLDEAELEALKQSGVKTVVVSSPRPAYKQLLERQAIQLAIVPRAGASPPRAQAPQTLRQRFDQEYTLLTPAEAAQLR
jgi:ABC-type sugar transport system substrate-binding protein